jgi:lipopolysaccharide transport system ATP-binding protein
VGSLLEVGTGFHGELSGRENIYLSGAILGMRKAEIERKFDEIVAFAEIEKFLDTPVKHYSSGMYVRLAFAVAAHLDPEILLVDEVLAVGDAQFQKKCVGKMQNFAREGRTVLFVSHNMAAVQSLCSKAIQLEDGEVIASGNVDDQVQLYLDRRQDASVTMNLPIQVSAGINLRKFGFSPNPVQSCRKVNFFLELSSDRHLKIEAAAILIYSHLDLRIAVVDLRGREVYRIDECTVLQIEGWIKSLPLVDGQYRVHLYLKYEGTDKHLLDLVRLEVGARTTKPNLVPLRAAARGIIELDTVFSANYG